MTGRRHYNPRPVNALGRRANTVGYSFVHIAIDDCTRLAYAEALPDEKTPTVLGFLARAINFYKRHGIRVERVMTDNGSAYRSTMHAIACRTRAIRHLRTQPRRPQTNGKNRTLHPHPARRLGLRRALRQRTRTHRSP